MRCTVLGHSIVSGSRSRFSKIVFITLFGTTRSRKQFGFRLRAIDISLVSRFRNFHFIVPTYLVNIREKYFLAPSVMRPLRFIICIKLFKWYMLLLRANVPSVKRFVLQAITVLIFYLIFCLAYRSLFHYFLSILVWPGPFCWLYFIYYLVKFTLGVYYRSVRRLRLMMLEWFD